MKELWLPLGYELRTSKRVGQRSTKAATRPQNDLHGHVEEDGEQELVVDGHGYEPALVELARSLPDHDAEPDAPKEKEKLN